MGPLVLKHVQSGPGVSTPHRHLGEQAALRRNAKSFLDSAKDNDPNW